MEDIIYTDKIIKIEKLKFLVDHCQCKIYINGEEVHLTFLQYKLLQMFLYYPNQILTREDLLTVWSEHRKVKKGNVDVQIHNLLKVLPPVFKDLIKSIHDKGYKFYLFDEEKVGE